MTGRLAGRTDTAWVEGVTSVFGPQAAYPYTNVWHELHEAVAAPGVWTFDADNQGWIDNGGMMHPAEWQAADGRILGEPSGPPTLWATHSSVFSLSIRPVGPGPFKVRATCAALQTAGAVASGDTAELQVGFWNQGGFGGTDLAIATSPVGGSTGWEVHESALWQPSPEWLADPRSKIQLRVCVNYSSSIMSAGNAEWRVQLNDATLLHADGSQAQYEVVAAKLGQVWNGSGWVDFI